MGGQGWSRSQPCEGAGDAEQVKQVEDSYQEGFYSLLAGCFPDPSAAPHAMVSPRISSTVLALLSLLLLLVALGSDHWLVDDTVLGSPHEGLWKSCLNSVCEQISSASVSLKVTRVFTLLGVIAGLVSSFALFASFLRSHPGSVSLTLVSFLGSFSAGLCAMIALAVYTGEFAGAVNAAQSQVTFGWSFGLGWASFLLFLITGVVMLVAHQSS
ncbi:protein NKG7-like isoform X2 [Dermochelys coriacea]|uniref:protein NKG7-like isoform X2 n=2 Tax=Dermochelys coriacea TaxID=27794 RepID=UPI001CA7F32F|nr:protein NKG7-like isoform X2 [Dermochelys coriacea]